MSYMDENKNENNKGKKFLSWSLAFLFVTLVLFLLNNLLELQIIKKSISLVLLATAVTFLLLGLFIRKFHFTVRSRNRILITIILCLIFSAILLIFFEKGLFLSLSFFFVWLIGGLSIYILERNNNESKKVL